MLHNPIHRAFNGDQAVYECFHAIISLVAQSFVFGPDYLKLPRNTATWIVEDLLPIGGSLNIFGKPKAGKSLFSMQMAACISSATVTDFLGFPIHLHGRVAYLQLDTPRSIWALDLEHAIKEGHNFDNVLFADKEMAPRPFDATTTGSDWLAGQIKEFQPVAIFVDTIRKTHDKDENQSGDMKIVLEKIQIAAGDASLVIISHERKGNPAFEEQLMNANRGSNYLAGEMDCILKCSKTRKASYVTYEGRTIDERRLTLSRTPLGFWSVDELDYKKKALFLLKEHPDSSINSVAEMLASESGMAKEAARSLLRRLKG